MYPGEATRPNVYHLENSKFSLDEKDFVVASVVSVQLRTVGIRARHGRIRRSFV